MDSEAKSVKHVIEKEVALLAVLLFFGLVLMPIGIFMIGEALFGSYGGHGYGEFFSVISEKIRSGDRVAWFLVLAPYMVWQSLRLMVKAWQRLGRHT